MAKKKKLEVTDNALSDEAIKTDKNEEIARVGDILGSENLEPDEFSEKKEESKQQVSIADDRAEKALGDSFDKMFGKLACIGLPVEEQKEKYAYFYDLSRDAGLGQNLVTCIEKWMGKTQISAEMALVGAACMFGMAVIVNRPDIVKAFERKKKDGEDKK